MGEDDTSRNRRPVKTIRFPWASGVVKKKAQKRSGVGSHRRVREEEVEEEEDEDLWSGDRAAAKDSDPDPAEGRVNAHRGLIPSSEIRLERRRRGVGK